MCGSCRPNTTNKAIRQAKALHPHQGEGFLCEVEAMLRAAVALQQQKALLSLETGSVANFGGLT